MRIKAIFAWKLTKFRVIENVTKKPMKKSKTSNQILTRMIKMKKNIISMKSMMKIRLIKFMMKKLSFSKIMMDRFSVELINLLSKEKE